MRIQILILGFEGLIRTPKGPKKVSVLTRDCHTNLQFQRANIRQPPLLKKSHRKCVILCPRALKTTLHHTFLHTELQCLAPGNAVRIT